MNKLILIGNLCKDPESRSLPTGVNLCSFTVAVNGRKEEDVQYFRVTTWRQLAENCQRFLSKGKKVGVVGSVKLSTYTTKDGKQGAGLEVNADEVEFLSPRDESVDAKSGMTVVDQPDDLPF